MPAFHKVFNTGGLTFMVGSDLPREAQKILNRTYDYHEPVTVSVSDHGCLTIEAGADVTIYAPGKWGFFEQSHPKQRRKRDSKRVGWTFRFGRISTRTITEGNY